MKRIRDQARKKNSDFRDRDMHTVYELILLVVLIRDA